MSNSKSNKTVKQKCSFCGRDESQVGFLITGINGCICDLCTQQAYDITKEAMSGNQKVQATKLNLKEISKPTTIKKFLDQ